jgi:N utilization substance protein A
MSGRNKKTDDIGPASAGQSGDLQQLPDAAAADSESVEELVEEGNAFEADAVQGVEDAKPPDVSEVKTREVPEDDVPAEYLDNDKDVA